jgi:ubiquinone/menaquinone biosynthesis C-methylase UbiE
MINLYDLLRCPSLLKPLIIEKDKNVLCVKDYSKTYEIIENIPVIFKSKSTSDVKIITWWKDLYQQLYFNFDQSLNKENILANLNLFEDLMKKQDHLLINEMLSNEIIGKTCLEIGSGSGAHSALMKSKGASVISVDITIERCVSTYKKLTLINGADSLVVNCNAENIPIKDESLDFVYSNGVLHHADNTKRCINEVHRVLKPNGRAIISLYCRQSAEYYFNLIPKAIIFGSIFKHKKEANWLGEITEGKTKYTNIKNPITRVYNKSEIKDLFSNFKLISLRKNCFSYKDFAIPRLTQFREKILKFIGCEYHKGGNIVYGRPIIPFTSAEKILGKYFGFFWYIVVEKKL